jgi:hypothetical protein
MDCFISCHAKSSPLFIHGPIEVCTVPWSYSHTNHANCFMSLLGIKQQAILQSFATHGWDSRTHDERAIRLSNWWEPYRGISSQRKMRRASQALLRAIFEFSPLNYMRSLKIAPPKH